MINFAIRHYFSHKIHPYLLANLNRRGLLPLKNFQIQALESIQNSNNYFLNSCTGSGKTLAYVIPILTRILYQKDQNTLTNPHGAIILTLNKQLSTQIYKQIKQLDIDHRLRITKTSTITDKQINAIQSQKQQKQTQNISSIIQWNNLDILISTPQALINQLTIYKQRNNYNHIDPEFIVIDQADIILEIDKNVRKNTDKVIKNIRDHSSNVKLIKYMLTASSFPNKFRGFDTKKKLEQNFRTLSFIQGENRHQLPQKLQLFFIEINEIQTNKIRIQKKAQLKKILTDRPNQRIIIFCKQKSQIKDLCIFINEQFIIKCQQYYAELSSQLRSSALGNFDEGKCNILVSSELGSRGLDFKLPVDCVIEYNMAENIVHFINRAGRTARNGMYGEVITFVQIKNKEFFQHLRILKEEGGQFDELFSRKRSYSKLYKQKEQE